MKRGCFTHLHLIKWYDIIGYTTGSDRGKQEKGGKTGAKQVGRDTQTNNQICLQIIDNREDSKVPEEMKEHNPDTCKICQEIGDWTTTPDTADFFEAHESAGCSLRIVDKRLIEVQR